MEVSRRRYQELSLTDGLTGLYNLRFFQDQLAAELRQSHSLNLPLSLVMMDLDNFKAVNDLHGHHAGDCVLAASVRYLIKNLRPYDKVFRYGGEEFLICMPYTELTPAHDRINELREGIAALEIGIDEKEPIHISASFGLTPLDPDIPVEASIDRADKALYAAKSAGRNCVRIWDSSM